MAPWSSKALSTALCRVEVRLVVPVVAVFGAVGACGHSVEGDDVAGRAEDASISDAPSPGFVSDATPADDSSSSPTIYFVDGGPSDDGGCESRPVACTCNGDSCDPVATLVAAIDDGCYVDSGTELGCAQIEVDLDDAGCAIRLGFDRFAGDEYASCFAHALDGQRWTCVPDAGSVRVTTPGPCGR